MKKFFALLLAALMMLAMVAGCAQPAEEPATEEPAAEVPVAEEPATEEPATEEPAAEGIYKVALLLPGSANDNSWNQIGYDSLMQAQEEIGADVIEVAYSENVTPIDTAQAIRDYAGKGYNLIFGHGGQFEDDMIKIGSEFPDTEFVAICGSYGGEVGSNVTAVDISACQQGYSYGYLAGMATKTNKVGMISAMEGVQVMNNVTGGFKDAVKTANPDCEVTIVYLKDNNDVAEGREAALALAAAGCDVIMHELNAASGGVVEVCKEKDIKTICRVKSDIEFAPEQVIGMFYFGNERYVSTIRLALEDKLDGGTFFYGYQTDPVGFGWYYDDANQWNPNIITAEMIAKYQTDVVEMFAADPLRTYTTEDAAPGTY